MPEATWRRSLTSIAAQLRERAALDSQAVSALEQAGREETQHGRNKTAAANQHRATHLRQRADTYREAARLLDDAEAMIASLQDVRGE
jgi:hypothetical protein